MNIISNERIHTRTNKKINRNEHKWVEKNMRAQPFTSQNLLLISFISLSLVLTRRQPCTKRTSQYPLRQTYLFRRHSHIYCAMWRMCGARRGEKRECRWNKHTCKWEMWKKIRSKPNNKVELGDAMYIYIYIFILYTEQPHQAAEVRNSTFHTFSINTNSSISYHRPPKHTHTHTCEKASKFTHYFIKYSWMSYRHEYIYIYWVIKCYLLYFTRACVRFFFLFFFIISSSLALHICSSGPGAETRIFVVWIELVNGRTEQNNNNKWHIKEVKKKNRCINM